MNSATGVIGIIVNRRAYNTISSIHIILSRIMTLHFQGNPHKTVISCYNPANTSDENETVSFYTELTSLTRHIPNHNILIIGGDFNVHLRKVDGYIYSLNRTTNRKGNMLHNFLLENNLLCLNTNFQKRSGQSWTPQMVLNHKLIS